jgi:hypothetical protein
MFQAVRVEGVAMGADALTNAISAANARPRKRCAVLPDATARDDLGRSSDRAVPLPSGSAYAAARV